MKLVNAQTQQVEDLAPEDAQTAFTSGSHNFIADQPVTIRNPDGSLGQVAAHDAQAALEQGASLASDEEFHKADVDARYGDLGHGLEAAGVGVARGLSLGGVDPLVIGAAKMFGSPQAAETVRQHLAGIQEAHPWASTAGEIAGAALPALVSDGATAGLTAEELATRGAAGILEKPSLISKALQWTPAGITSQIGAGTEKVVAKHILGAETAKSALGRIGQEATKNALSNAVEGMIFAGGSEFSEDALNGGDSNLTAQKFVAALGHGGAYGLLLGGGGAAVIKGLGEAARPILSRGKGALLKNAGIQAAKSIGMDMKGVTEAEQRAGMTARELAEEAEKVGGTSMVGRTVLHETGIGRGSITEGAKTPEEWAPHLEQAQKNVGERLDEIGRQAGLPEANTTIGQATSAFDGPIAEAGKHAGQENVVRDLQKLKESVATHLGAAVDEAPLQTEAREFADKAVHEWERANTVDENVIQAGYERGLFNIMGGSPENTAELRIERNALKPHPHISDVKVDSGGMRPESFSGVRAFRKSGEIGQPIVLDKYPDSPLTLSDGRHRLMVAKKDGDSTIPALIKHYDAKANVLREEAVELGLQGTPKEHANTVHINVDEYSNPTVMSNGKAILDAQRKGEPEVNAVIHRYREGRHVEEERKVLRVLKSEEPQSNYERSKFAPGTSEHAAEAKAIKDHAYQNEFERLRSEALASQMNKPIKVSDFVKQRQAVGAQAYERIRSLEPNVGLSGKYIRKAYAAMTHLEDEILGETARKINRPELKELYTQTKKDYQRMRIAVEANKRAVARRVLSPKANPEYGSFAAHALGGLALGHPLAGVATGLASKAAKSYLNEHGNGMAAVALAKMANLDMLASATKQVDHDLDYAISTLRGNKPRVRVRRFTGVHDGASPEEKYEEGHSTTSAYRMMAPEHVEEALPGMAAHAPKVTQSTLRTVNSVATYVAASRPPPLNAPTLADPTPKPRTDELSAIQFHQLRKAASDPVGVLCDGLETGNVTRTQVHAIQTNYPDLFSEFQQKVVAELAKPRAEPIEYDKLVTLSTIFGIAADPSLDSAHVGVYQSAFKQSAPPDMAEDTGTPAKPHGSPDPATASRLALEKVSH